MILLKAGAFFLGIIQVAYCSTEDLSLRKHIANQYRLLQQLTQNSVFKAVFNDKKSKNLISGSNKNAPQLTQTQFEESIKSCRLSLKAIKILMNQIKPQESSFRSCQDLYSKAKLLKSELHDMHFSSTGIEKVKKCQELIHQIIELFDNTDSLKSYIKQEDPLTSRDPQVLAKPLKGEKLPEKNLAPHRTQDNLEKKTGKEDPVLIVGFKKNRHLVKDASHDQETIP